MSAVPTARAAWLHAGIVAACVAGVVAVPMGPWRPAAEVVLFALGVVAARTALVRHRTSSRLTWWALGAGLALFGLSSGAEALELSGIPVGPAGVAESGLDIAAYAALAVGAFAVARRGGRRQGRSAWLDAATLLLASALALLAFSRSAASCSCSSTWAFRLETTPSRRRSLSSSSASWGFLLLRGARPGPGKMHSILARTQLEHGCFLSHLTCGGACQCGDGNDRQLECRCTLRRRHVTHDRGFGVGAPPRPDEGPLMLPLALCEASGECKCSAIGESSDMALGGFYWHPAIERGEPPGILRLCRTLDPKKGCACTSVGGG